MLLSSDLIFHNHLSYTGFVKVKCSAENKGQYGQESLLNCVVETSKEVKDPEILVVTWQKEGVKGPLLFYHSEQLSLKQGYKFADPSWNSKNMNVSLLISNTAVEDEGVYTCHVVTDSGHHEGTTKLQVSGESRQAWLTV